MSPRYFTALLEPPSKHKLGTMEQQMRVSVRMFIVYIIRSARYRQPTQTECKLTPADTADTMGAMPGASSSGDQ